MSDERSPELDDQDISDRNPDRTILWMFLAFVVVAIVYFSASAVWDARRKEAIQNPSPADRIAQLENRLAAFERACQFIAAPSSPATTQ